MNYQCGILVELYRQGQTEEFGGKNCPTPTEATKYPTRNVLVQNGKRSGGRPKTNHFYVQG